MEVILKGLYSYSDVSPLQILSAFPLLMMGKARYALVMEGVAEDSNFLHHHCFEIEVLKVVPLLALHK